MSLHWRNERMDSSGSVDDTKIGLGTVAATLGQAVKGELQVRNDNARWVKGRLGFEADKEES